MRIKKKVLAELEKVYSVCAVELAAGTHLLAATELEGRCLLFSPPDWSVSEVWDKPGGTMSLVPVDGCEGAFLAIQKFFPVFKSEEACMVYVKPGDDIKKPWNVYKMADLPFCHRIEVIKVGSVQYAAAASLCGGKDCRDDWSRPGTVYVGRIPENPEDCFAACELKPVLEGITKNHGMHITQLRIKPEIVAGRSSLLVSGQEGVFRIRIPAGKDEPWPYERLIDHEVSDVFAADIDKDNLGEIITIEPFHGNTMAIYKYVNCKWEAICKEPVNFGHAIWGGEITGKPSVIIGNRGGAGELLLLIYKEGICAAERLVLDEKAGPAQVAVVHRNDCDLVLSANHAAGEVALYEIYP